MLNELRGWVRRSGISQRSLSKASGVSEATLSLFMHDKIDMSGVNVERLAEALNLELVQTKDPCIPKGRKRGRPRRKR